MESNLIKEISKSIGLIFLLERRLEYLFDKALAPSNLTTKQWLLLAAIEKSQPDKPSVQEAAKKLSTSHQNVKAIALNLEKRGFLTLFKDPKDKRVTRLAVTPQCREFWAQREPEDELMLIELFKHLSYEDNMNLPRILIKLLRSADELTEKISSTDTLSEEDYRE